MSISAYIEDVTNKINSRIQDNENYILDNPDSEDNLERSLENEKLRATDPRDLLDNSYNTFIENVSNAVTTLGSDIDMEFILGLEEDFNTIYSVASADSDLFDIDPSLAKSAFSEIYSNELNEEPAGETEEESLAINLEDEVGEIEEEEDEELFTPEGPAEENIPDLSVSFNPFTLPQAEETDLVENTENTEVNKALEGTLEPNTETPSIINEIELEQEPVETENEPLSSVISNISNTIGVLETEDTDAVETIEEVAPINPINSTEGAFKSIFNDITESISENVLSGDIISSLNLKDEANYSTEDISSEGGINNITDTVNNFTKSLSPETSSLFNTTNLMGIGEDILSSNPISGGFEGITGILKDSPIAEGVSGIDKISNFSVPSIAELGPGPEPVTNESITQLGDTISSTVMNQTLGGGGSTPGVKDKPQSVIPSESRPINQAATDTSKSSDTIISNAGLAEAIESLRSEMISIKRLLQGPLDVKIKGNR